MRNSSPVHTLGDCFPFTPGTRLWKILTKWGMVQNKTRVSGDFAVKMQFWVEQDVNSFPEDNTEIFCMT